MSMMKQAPREPEPDQNRQDAEDLRQALSALLDGETDASETARLLRAWPEQPVLRQRWQAYQLIGDSLRAAEARWPHRPAPRHQPAGAQPVRWLRQALQRWLAVPVALTAGVLLLVMAGWDGPDPLPGAARLPLGGAAWPAEAAAELPPLPASVWPAGLGWSFAQIAAAQSPLQPELLALGVSPEAASGQGASLLHPESLTSPRARQ